MVSLPCILPICTSFNFMFMVCTLIVMIYSMVLHVHIFILTTYFFLVPSLREETNWRVYGAISALRRCYIPYPTSRIAAFIESLLGYNYSQMDLLVRVEVKMLTSPLPRICSLHEACWAYSASLVTYLLINRNPMTRFELFMLV